MHRLAELQRKAKRFPADKDALRAKLDSAEVAAAAQEVEEATAAAQQAVAVQADVSSKLTVCAEQLKAAKAAQDSASQDEEALQVIANSTLQQLHVSRTRYILLVIVDAASHRRSGLCVRCASSVSNQCVDYTAVILLFITCTRWYTVACCMRLVTD
jgi:hypothetical protein